MHGPRPLLFLLALLAASPAAHAQTDDDLAKEYYELGEKLYHRSDYEGALKQFQQAFKYSQRPAFWYNMARCYEFMGQLQQAIEHYEKFLGSKPKNAPEVQARIANLKKRLKPEKQPASQPTAAPATAPAQPKATKPRPAPPQPQPQPAPAPARSRWMRTLGWVTVGAGGAILVTSVILGVGAAGKARDIEDASTKPAEEWSDWQGKWDEGQALENFQILTLAVGAAVVAGGAVLLYLDYRKESQRRQAWIAPSVAPGGALVSAGLRF